MSSTNWSIALGGFAIALALRLLNLPLAFEHGIPQIAPTDELYHWKRIAFTAEHFPQVLEFDCDRGVNGAFCPWPPLYDFTAGAVARVFGMRAVVWIPPIVGAIAVAIAALWVATRFGLIAGATAAIALASSPFIVTQSWIGAIDHHFLEWPLVFAIVVTLIANRYTLFAVAITVALFVQTALIIACGFAFVVCFARDDRRAAGAFFASAIAVVLYRVTRPLTYPDSPWFLGWPHAILLVAAGGALLIRPRWAGLLCGAAIALVAPVRQGLHFFYGDPWLETIVEFQPMWRSHGADLLSQIVGLGAGAILAWILLRRRDTWPIAFFATAFLLLTIANRRFWSISIPLLAIAGAIAVSHLRVRRLAAAFVAFIPLLQLTGWMQQPQTAIDPNERPWIAAAEFLRTQPPGLVLAPWPLGHAVDVIGKHHIIIDGFGSMPDPVAFELAMSALHADANALTAYCARMDIRYVIRPLATGGPAGWQPAFRSGSLVVWVPHA